MDNLDTLSEHYDDSQPNVFESYAQTREPSHYGGGSDGGDGAFRTGGCHRHMKALINAALIVLVIFILAAAFYYRPASGRACHKRAGLAETLGDAGWVVYYRQGCGYCDEQRRVLGKPHLMPSVECDPAGRQMGGDAAPLPCGSPVITGYPFWLNVRSGEARVGLQGHSALENMASY